MRNLHLLLASLVIACLVWVMHTFSLEYTASINCSVTASTKIPGHAREATAREILVLRGKATGFYILKARGIGGRPMPLSIQVDSKYFTPVPEEEDTYSLNISEVRDKLSEQLGESFVIDFIETGRLTFVFFPQAYLKIPVAGSFDLSFRPQYMQVGQVKFDPDSVLVYGDVSELQRLREIRAHSVSAKGLDRDRQGTVALEVPAGLSPDIDKVRYEVKVARYVEMTMTVPVTVANMPDDKSLMLLPSQVEMTFRAPFHPKGGRITADDVSLVIDYADYAQSKSTRMIPRLVTDREIYSWRFEPGMIDCIGIGQ